MIRFDTSHALQFVKHNEIENQKEMVVSAHKALHEKTGAGSEFTGWVDLPVNYDKVEFERIKKCSEKIREDSDILIVVGIGGSYLGARAAIEMLAGSFYNLQRMKDKKGPMVLFAGNSISSAYMHELVEFIENYDVSINVISKSGTTTEPAIAFRILKERSIQRRSCKENLCNN